MMSQGFLRVSLPKWSQKVAYDLEMLLLLFVDYTHDPLKVLSCTSQICDATTNASTRVHTNTVTEENKSKHKHQSYFILVLALTFQSICVDLCTCTFACIRNV